MFSLLKAHFGFDTFRPLQQEIIEHVLAGKNTLVILPTGGGKSLCYQLPALKFSGLTLVVSPLVALMKDQVDALRANGIAAAYINSTLTFDEIEKTKKQALDRKLKLIYIAPERLTLPNFQRFLQQLKVSLIAIDEAHCISEWGHDFRPDYRNLKTLRQDFPQTPVVALTATATPQVRSDILDQLKFQDAKTFIGSFDRPNLIYTIQPKQQAFDRLLELLQKYKNKPAIIYCFSRRDTENLVADLREADIAAQPYHAGLANDVRQQNQEQFIRDEISVICATIAFGMGIDKPDVRLIAHYSLPKSIEGYYQETGRAGRDSLPAECVLFYSYGDKFKQDFFINQIEDSTERERAASKLTTVIDFCESIKCHRKFLLEYFGEPFEVPATEQGCGGCGACLSVADQFDATEIAQKILSCVIRTGERFGAAHIATVLTGSSNPKIKQLKHDQLPTFGVVQNFSAPELQQLCKYLTTHKLLQKAEGQYPTLSLTEAGHKFLQDREQIQLVKPVARIKIRTPRENGLKFNAELFEELRQLRKQIADRENVPPFMIFGDRSLQEMAAYLPQSLESFERINGVGSRKLSAFGQIFITAIQQFAAAHDLSESTPPARRQRRERRTQRGSSTHEATKKLVQQKLSIQEIAKQRGFTFGTIVGHLEKLVNGDEQFNLDYLQPPEQEFDEISAVFRETDSGALGPVREKTEWEV